MRTYRDTTVVIGQIVVIAFSLTAALAIRLDFDLLPENWALLAKALVIVIPIKLSTFLVGRLHKGSWRHAGLPDLARIGFVNIIGSVLAGTTVMIWQGKQFPRSAYIIDFLICFLLTAAARYAVRLFYEGLKPALSRGQGVLIYGAGAAGVTLLREIRSNPSLGFRVMGFIDDNSSVQSMRIMDVPVLGGGRQISNIVDRFKSRSINIQEIIIAMPSATGRQMREAHANCRAANLQCRTIPSLGDLLSGNYLSSQLRKISLDDLLGRKQIQLEEHRIEHSIVGRSILITGAAGSIGSELCRQTAGFSPARLVIFDQAESDLFKIDMELRKKHPDLEIIPVIGDIRQKTSVEDTVRRYSIESIYHSAAYKHVPMMESHILEAVINNVIGTWNVVEVSRACGVGSFVMISSDKAVNPTSVMGLTKRVAELIVSSASREKHNVTNFVSVRFGNVLGSNGSVVPTFQAQIEAGGPVTVTHPEMRRYFMSIREAVQLVLQASTMGKGADIFVLDMGEPVRILDLAHNMIQLAGLVPEEDIELRITGLRPGEKLFEEIALDGENILPTHHKQIRIFKGKEIEPQILASWMARLHSAIDARDDHIVLRQLAELVPEYKSPQLDGKAVTIRATARAVGETAVANSVSLRSA